MKRWFQASAEVDAQMRSDFQATVDKLLEQPPHSFQTNAELEPWKSSAEGTLAAILLLDQVPRNIFRGSARAFAGDPLALRFTDHAIHSGFEKELHPLKRAFLYFPLEHAESLPEQERSVERFSALPHDVPAADEAHLKGLMEGFRKYAVDHESIIRQFGRYPHRNKVLGRENTEAEIKYLDTAARYGQ